MRRERKKARRVRTDAPAPRAHTGDGRRIVQRGFLPLAIALAIGCLLLFWRTLHYEFVWDDEGYNLTANAELMKGDYRFFWEHAYVDFYIPVSYGAWIGLKSINDATGDPGVLRPEVFRAANLAVHAANAVLVMCLAFMFCRSTVASFAAGALFAAHPLQVESVVWVSEFRGVLAAFFSLVAIIVHLRNCSRPGARPALVTVGLLTTLAMLAKRSAVVLPLILLIADWMAAGEIRLTRKRVFYVAVWCALAVPVIIITTRLVQPAAEIEAAVPILLRPFVASDAFNHYVLKTLLPLSLSVSYGRTPPLVLRSSLTYTLWILPVAAALASVWAYRRHPKPVLALVLAAVAFVPVSGLLLFKGQNYSTVADRYAYFPMVGVALQRDGRHEEAIGQFDASLRNDSKYADPVSDAVQAERSGFTLPNGFLDAIRRRLNRGS